MYGSVPAATLCRPRVVLLAPSLHVAFPRPQFILQHPEHLDLGTTGPRGNYWYPSLFDND